MRGSVYFPRRRVSTRSADTPTVVGEGTGPEKMCACLYALVRTCVCVCVYSKVADTSSIGGKHLLCIKDKRNKCIKSLKRCIKKVNFPKYIRKCIP